MCELEKQTKGDYMEEKTRKLAERHKATLVQLAQSQAYNAIGETAERMHLDGAEITKVALIAELLRKAHAPRVQLLEREQYEQAARLLGWLSSAPQD